MGPRIFSPSSSPDQGQGWTLEADVLVPTASYTDRLNTYLAERTADDVTLAFTFHGNSSPPVKIHSSRLEWAGGPLRALTQHDFREQSTRTVDLSAEDNLPVFLLVRDFLYGKQVKLGRLPLTNVLEAMRASHRWMLADLFCGLALFVRDHGLLATPMDVLLAVDTFELPDIPRGVLIYFWERVGASFWFFGRHSLEEQSIGDKRAADSCSDSAMSTDRDSDCDSEEQDLGEGRPCLRRRSDTPPVSFEGSTGGKPSVAAPEQEEPVAEDNLPIECRLCPRFSGLWPLAISHGMVKIAMHHIVCNAGRRAAPACLDVILQYLEPRIEDDNTVCDLIAQVGLDTVGIEDVLNRASLDSECSARAIRLLAKTLLTPRLARQEMRYSWSLNLHEPSGFTKDVMFTPENPELAEYGYREDSGLVRERLERPALEHKGRSMKRSSKPSKYDVVNHSSVRFSLSCEYDPLEMMGVILSWSPGVLFEDAEEMLHVSLELLDDGCKCTTRHSDMSYPGEGGCLLRGYEAKMICQAGDIELIPDEDLIDRYLAVHDNACSLTVSLLVRMI